MYCLPDHKEPLEFSTDYVGPLDHPFYQEITETIRQRQKWVFYYGQWAR